MCMQEAAGGPKPALRIVSLHADLTNRGPTFDMDLAELEEDGQPLSYEEARQYFKRDPAHRSAQSHFSARMGAAVMMALFFSKCIGEEDEVCCYLPRARVSRQGL